jgi:hypothetical protein
VPAPWQKQQPKWPEPVAGAGRLEVHALLESHGIPLRYTEADLQDDLAAHREAGILRD